VIAPSPTSSLQDQLRCLHCWHLPCRRAERGARNLFPPPFPRRRRSCWPCAARLAPSAAAAGPHCAIVVECRPPVLPFNHPCWGARLRAPKNFSAVSGFQLLVPTLLAGGHRHPAQFRAGTTRPALAEGMALPLAPVLPAASPCSSVWRPPLIGVLLVRTAGFPSPAPWLLFAVHIWVPAALGHRSVCSPCWRGQWRHQPPTTARSALGPPWPAVRTCPGGQVRRGCLGVAEIAIGAPGGPGCTNSLSLGGRAGRPWLQQWPADHRRPWSPSLQPQLFSGA